MQIKRFMIIFIALYYLIVSLSLSAVLCWADEYPSKLKVEQKFKEGDTFNYMVTDIAKGDSRNNGGIETMLTANYLLEVPHVSSDGTVDIIIKKSSESVILNNKIDLTRNVKGQVQVRFKILPDGKVTEKQSADRSSIMWREIILRNLPPKELSIGETWRTSSPVEKSFAKKGENQREFTILGFEKYRGYDCIKVKIVSKTTASQSGVTRFIFRTEREALLAYKRGFLVVKSHRKLESKYITKNKDEEMSTFRETIVELKLQG